MTKQQLIDEYIGDYKIGDEVIVYNMRLLPDTREKIKVVITEINDSSMFPNRKIYKTLSNRGRHYKYFAYEMKKVE